MGWFLYFVFLLLHPFNVFLWNSGCALLYLLQLVAKAVSSGVRFFFLKVWCYAISFQGCSFIIICRYIFREVTELGHALYGEVGTNCAQDHVFMDYYKVLVSSS